MAKRRYRIGDKFTLTEEQAEHYGFPATHVFTVTGVFTHYVSPKEMANDPTGHPGFDSDAGSALYEAEGFNCAVYEWEMEPAS